MRPLRYRGANVFILSFSLVSRASYENVLKKVLMELPDDKLIRRFWNSAYQNA